MKTIGYVSKPVEAVKPVKVEEQKAEVKETEKVERPKKK